MNIILVLKSFEKPCLVKTSFTFDQVAKELLLKSINKFSMFGISNEDNERLSQIALKMWCFIVSWCICRNWCVENHGLCLSHYWNTPASSWEAMLSMTKFELDLISEADMYLFLKKEG